MDLSQTIAPKSDQLDSIDLVDGPRTFTVTRLSAGSDEQPVNIHFAEFPRPWRPSKNMRRVLTQIWGSDGTQYVGRRITLYRDPEVTFGKEKPGGTRISHMSHIDKVTEAHVMVSRGRMGKYTVKPLPDTAPQQQHDLADRIGKAIAAFDALGTTQADLEQHIGRPVAEWTPDDLQALMGLYAQKNTPAVDTTTGEVIEEQA
ncbi:MULTISPECIES: hypothetical protein [Micrococcales]|uniref:hypothetical protein n=1 Tax=Micrococcales TaxID=85006 RepID=UPI00259710C5|nr:MULTISPECIES: hypothetical protein [Micrococcales]